MMLQSRVLALRLPPALYSRSLAVTQRVFQALTQTRADTSLQPTSTGNNQLAIIKRQLHNSNISNSPYVVPGSDESDGEDPMLALVIKLSLEQENSQRSQPKGESSLGKLSKVAQGKRKADFIVISDTESDSQSSKKVKGGSEASTSPGGKMMVARGGPKSGGGISPIGLDREQMERERLERLGKRMLSSTAGAQGGGIWDGKGAKLASFYPPVDHTLGGTEAKGHRGKGKGKASIHARDNTSNPTNLPFPNGTVKKTWVDGVQRDGTEIKIEEVLEIDTLEGAVLSSYRWDYDWILSKISCGNFPWLVLVIQAKTEREKEWIADGLDSVPGTVIVFPPIMNLGSMHSKLMLLFHRRLGTGEEWLRVVVASANLVDYDWGERGTIENTVFLIDLPKLPTPQKSDMQFATSLYSFCKAKGIPLEVLNKLNNYDFSATKGMAFVHSICGAHYEEEVWKNTGYCGLGTAIKNLGYSSGKGLLVDLVTSSLGSTHRDFVTNIYNAAMGFDGSSDLRRRPPIGISHPKNHKNLNKKKPEPKIEVASDMESDIGIEHDEETSWERIKEMFRLYFPSRDTVLASRGGGNSAGTIRFQANMWGECGYPKELVRDCVSVRKGILMHNRMVFARPAKQLDTPIGKVDAWAYIGSANFNESSWGKLVMCRGKMIPKIRCKNWECGVVVPVIAKPESGQTLSGKVPRKLARAGMEVFGSVIPVPMETPGECIHPGKLPWFFTEYSRMGAQDTKIGSPPQLWAPKILEGRHERNVVRYIG